MDFGISTSFLWTEESPVTLFLEKIKQAGFDLLEFDAHTNAGFPHTSTQFIGELKQKLQKLGMIINSIHAPYHNSISSPDKIERDEGINDIIRLMEKAMPLLENCSEPVSIVIHPGHHLSRTPKEVQFACCRESLGKILNSPVSNNYRICIENMLSSHFGAKAEELIGLIKSLGEENLFICLDTSHAVYDGCPEKLMNDVFPHIATTHISDNFNQPLGEFHAIPMTLVHSKINWPYLFNRISEKLDRIMFELIRPDNLDLDVFLKIARLSAQQADRFIED